MQRACQIERARNRLTCRRFLLQNAFLETLRVSDGHGGESIRHNHTGGGPTMSDAEGTETGNLFLQMVLTLQTSAMQHLGKIASPFTGKVERDLLSAKAAIDMLVMLQDKTRGNLNDAEVKILDRVVYELRMNYVDEAKKPDPPEEEEEGEKEEEKEEKREGEGEEKEEGKEKS